MRAVGRRRAALGAVASRATSGLDEPGSALVEALVAVSLLAIASSATTVVVRASSAAQHVSRTRSVATVIAHDEVERLHAMDADELVRRVDAAPARTLVEAWTHERDGRRWRVERRLVRLGSAASAPACDGQPATDVRPVRGSIRVVALDDAPRAGAGEVVVPFGLASMWPVGVDGALVVRVGDGAVAPSGLPGIEVDVDGPLGHPTATVRRILTDDAGCAWLGGLSTGNYRVTLRSAGRIDASDRRAGTMADGTAPVGDSDVTFLVGVSLGSRPALEVALPLAGALRVDVLAPDGAAVREGVDLTGDPTRGLVWWLEDDADGVERRVVPAGAVRWVAPRERTIAVGGCPPDDDVDRPAEERRTSTVLVGPGEEVLHLVPLVPVVIQGLPAAPVPDGSPPDGPPPDERFLVARWDPHCTTTTAPWRWQVDGRVGELLIGLPRGPVSLVLEGADGRGLRDALAVVVVPGPDGTFRVELDR